MNSIWSHISPNDLAAQVRMERQKHKGVFFLLEGATDVKRFKKFFNSVTVSPIICRGKCNVIDTLDIVQNSGFEDCLGFVDADFDRVLSTTLLNDDLIHSENHDFDVDVCKTAALQRYFDEVADGGKLGPNGGATSAITALAISLKPLSALRFANVKHGLGYKLDGLKLYEFFDGTTVDVTAMIDLASAGKFSSASAKATLLAHIERYKAANFDIWQFTNGHDLIAAVGIALQGKIGDRKIPQATKVEVERHLRLTFDRSDLAECGLFAKIVAWQSTRTTPDVLWA